LKAVVQEAVSRWFNDTLLDAKAGDVKQQALLGQMYSEGYGCAKDPAAAKEWTEKARSRGYRMRGVYCEL
jgi:TPR repeat protein